MVTTRRASKAKAQVDSMGLFRVLADAEIGVIADVISRNHNSITSLDRRDLVLQLRELGMSERRFGYILAIAMRNDELKSEIEQSVGDRLRSSSAE